MLNRCNASNAVSGASPRNARGRIPPTLVRTTLALAVVAWTSHACAGICRVTDVGTPSGDGSDWGVQALTLQSALALPTCTEVWVRAGVYTPTTDANPAISFNIGPGVAVYGGFDGTETTRDARDAAAHVTILSGDIDENDTDVDNNHIAENAADIQGTNSRRLIMMDGTTAAGPIVASTVLDGFVVTAGDYVDVQQGKGAGLYCKGAGGGNGCSPTLRQLAFMGNRASLGAAIFDDGVSGTSSPTIERVTFAGNFATNFGGAIFNYGDGGNASPVLTHVVFMNNRADARAGAMYNQGNSGGTSSPLLNSVTFSSNSAQNLGGALLNSSTAGGSSRPSLTNVTFSANVATGSGGAIYNGAGAGGDSSPTLFNVTFNGNHAHDGGAIYNGAGAGMVHPTYSNVILWGDSAVNQGPEIYNNVSGGGSAASTIAFSIVDGGDAGSFRSDGSTDTAFSSGVGNLAADPLLGVLGDNGGATPTMLPAAGSAAIDAGGSGDCPAADQRGVARPQGPRCDIGAVEVEVDVIFADGFEQPGVK
jgi:predicted outer membrane repeat protein